MQIYVIQFDSDLWQVGDFLRYSGSSTNKTDRHDIAEILLKVAFKTITSNRSWVHLLLKCSYDVYLLCDSANDHTILDVRKYNEKHNKNDHTIGPFSKSRKRQNLIPLTQIYDRSLFWLGTDTSIKSGGVKLPLWAKHTPC